VPRPFVTGRMPRQLVTSHQVEEKTPPIKPLAGKGKRGVVAGEATPRRPIAAQAVGYSQKGHHFGRPVGTTLPESILVGPTALHLMLRAVGSTRLCHASDTSGAHQIGIVVPSKGVTDTQALGPVPGFSARLRLTWRLVCSWTCGMVDV
jgi:hypothetical protein